MAPNPILQLFPIVAIFGVMYLLLIRPQQKQQKELKLLQEGLKKHDEVITIGGIYGTVVEVKDKSITLRIDDNVRVRIERNSVSRLIKEG